MNKYQEAFNKIMPTTSDYELIEATKIIRQLVDKETPMKPATDIEGLKKCPRCKHADILLETVTIKGLEIGSVKLRRCPGIKCGQTIDWTNDEA